MGIKKERIVDKNLAVKLARKRLSVLQLAGKLGNVTEACRRRGMDRTSFFAWKYANNYFSEKTAVTVTLIVFFLVEV